MPVDVTPRDSILRTIAKLVDADGLEGTDQYFDTDLVIYINAAIFELYQVGVGVKGYYINDESDVWGDFIGNRPDLVSPIKEYIYLSVKTIFDPPASSAVAQAYKETAERLLYRIREQVECTGTL